MRDLIWIIFKGIWLNLQFALCRKVRGSFLRKEETKTVHTSQPDTLAFIGKDSVDHTQYIKATSVLKITAISMMELNK